MKVEDRRLGTHLTKILYWLNISAISNLHSALHTVWYNRHLVIYFPFIVCVYYICRWSSILHEKRNPHIVNYPKRQLVINFHYHPWPAFAQCIRMSSLYIQSCYTFAVRISNKFFFNESLYKSVKCVNLVCSNFCKTEENHTKANIIKKEKICKSGHCNIMNWMNNDIHDIIYNVCVNQFNGTFLH